MLLLSLAFWFIVGFSGLPPCPSVARFPSMLLRGSRRQASRPRPHFNLMLSLLRHFPASRPMLTPSHAFAISFCVHLSPLGDGAVRRYGACGPSKSVRNEYCLILMFCLVS
ncbi:uncharacterized protein BO95DRAFT_174054 [Aspergillus brunneoviolaceus CBS 621.78]|uniref:Uncharacterized protein n=1 Tax=Aspergillus brunneoviolaceus CBS 621.78 TaxID=1450534 RepID=A0ACD1G5I0_9EURO|nr:hypothetical protein BO95DRAFT_174054 [Aspergillus brunneoviolaceus CBS 621.78]RAH44492.1 hypothetical protein BO95DRAFT_174054 [Aspergillus brunneoviolaceus CBS 621.78]